MTNERNWKQPIEANTASEQAAPSRNSLVQTVQSKPKRQFRVTSASVALLAVVGLAGCGDAFQGEEYDSSEESTAETSQSVTLAGNGSVSAYSDTYVQRDDSGPYGTSGHIHVKNAGSSYTTRKGLIRFSVPNGLASAATLSLDVSIENHATGGSTYATFNVWGMKDGSSCGESFVDSTLKYSHLSMLDDSADGVIDNSACLHDGDPMTAGVQSLGTFQISAANLNKTVGFSSSALADFMSQNANGNVTLLITRQEQDGQLNTSFAAGEHSTLNPPRLSWLSPDVYTATGDTYVKKNDENVHGSETGIVVTNYPSHDYDRIGFVKFAVPTNTFSDASLGLMLGSYVPNGVNSATIYVFGVKDGTTGCQEHFSEASLATSGVSYFDDTADNIWNSSSCLHTPGPIAWTTISAADVGKEVVFRSPELTRFMSANKNSDVVFALSTVTEGPYIAFNSRENVANTAPTLTTVSASEMVFENGISIPSGGGTVAYQGKFHIPTFGGGMIGFPGANVTMTFNAQGHLSTISGTVGFPELPSTGTFGGLGPLSANLPYLQIGYDYPTNFNTHDLPLDPASKFFYLTASSGVSVEWGPMSMNAPLNAGLLLAVDPSDPTVWTYVAQDGTFPFFPIATELGIGISNGDNIEFSPDTTWGVESKMTSFQGDMFVMGSISPPLKNPYVEVTLSGEVAAQFNDLNFAAKENDDWLQEFGANARVDAALTLGWFSISANFAKASVRYSRNHSAFALSAQYNPSVDTGNLLNGLPFKPSSGTNVKVALYASDVANTSYLDVDADLKFGTAFSKQRIHAKAHITETGGTFDGTAKFGGTTIDVAGTVVATSTQKYVTFSGEVDTEIDLSVGRAKMTVKTSFDSRQQEVSLSAKAKFCLAGNCDGISIKDLSVNSSGQLHICVDVPAVGDRCTTLD